MAREDEEKTAFYIEQGTYCYMKMPFGLKNAGATYQRLVDSTFQSQIGRNLEAYVDDMVIKSKDEKDLLADIAKNGQHPIQPKAYRISLSPKKHCRIAKVSVVKLASVQIGVPGHVSRKGLSLSSNTFKNITTRKQHLCTGRPRRQKRFSELRWLINYPFHSLTPPFEGDTVCIPRGQWARRLSQLVLADRSNEDNAQSKGLRMYFEGVDPSQGQVLGMISCQNAPDGEAEEEYFRMPEVPPEVDDTEVWTLFTDGAASLKGSGAGLVLIGPSGSEYTYALRLTFVPFSHLTKEILVEVLNERFNDAWRAKPFEEDRGELDNSTIIKYLEEGIVPSDKNKARFLRAKISQYVMESGVLFKKGYLVPMMRCVGPLQANYVIWEIHIGSCGMHIGPRVVVRKAMRQGYYWPTMHADAKEEPFYQWGIDILGLLTPARGGAKFVIVAIDYFTKWIEAKPLVKITGIQCGGRSRRLNLVLFTEKKEVKQLPITVVAKYKTKMEQYYNKRVRPTGFRPGEFVYRKNEASRMEDEGKLGPNWEGPYRVTEAFENGSYKLQTMEDKVVPRTWHAVNLRKCYL
ncbi:reverse transcriptase domain-containing protein [Tanacetum coccineum]|uniref:Reverse transcriptase domain-containing protein n=1 Tax=Tanacetum coccineum TaxID=301880 RepID=A0ABQ5FNT8_9ASTR